MKLKQETLFGAPEKLARRKTTHTVTHDAPPEERIVAAFKRFYREANGKAPDLTVGDWKAVKELLAKCNHDAHELERHMREYVPRLHRDLRHKASPMHLLANWTEYGQSELPL